ncbi:2-dehydropantoate 2-reductase [Paramagnetospirillum caucaseum]|uniref:2-dehydropantoate 2-reductase n=1 Tax=Paramagnetospirillum caucaseum TaxID=1244869 RepID=M3A4Y9_9PROT|nr:2-dehydropantoate 2-reductase [Paramagnetospirillum caucaseum]EME67913.1 2-dehydropantoate 2-reductase [Paramagnetospirillum caucaseum]
MRILVLGAGATGGYFGGRLAEAGADVTFLVRPRRAALLAAGGLSIESPHGDAKLKVRTVTADTLSGHWDAVLLSCKAYDLEESIKAIAPAVGPDSMVVPILNGLAHYGPLDEAFGAGRVIGGLCHIFSTLGPEGQILHMNTIHRITFGERSGGTSPRTEALARAFSGARCETRHSAEVMQEAWEKYVLLAPMAAMTCLMRANIGTIMATGDGETLMRQAFEECARVAAHAGHGPRPEARDLALGFLTQKGSAMTASMMRDLEGGGPTEGEHIVGDMVRRARAAGVAAPLLATALAHLQAYEIRRKG